MLTKRLQYRYNAVGNKVGMTDADGGLFTYTYDVMRRLTGVINPLGERTTYVYDLNGRRTSVQLANGTRTSYSYDQGSRVQQIHTLKSNNSTVAKFDYAYDDNGRRTSVLEADGSRVTWTYDGTSQVTSEWRTGTSPFRHTFVYDTRGNRTLKIEDGARTTLVYDAANQLSSSEDAGGTTNYTYDANGNQHVTVASGGSRTTQIWDYENRLVKTLQPGGGVFTMAYDADGLRVRKETPSEAKLFVWDDQNYLAETDDSGVTEVAYTTEPSTYGSTISHRSGGATTTYHFDALAAARVLTNTSETVLESYNYTAFGTIQGTPTLLSPFLWGGLVGYYWDADLAAQYIRARHYQPSIARWISLDPIGFAGGDSNLFRYVGNLPTSGWLTDSNVDPSGLQPSTIPPQPKWTCETARKKLQQLYNIWQLLGFTISADLLLRFLNQTKTDSNDLSASICPELDKRLSFTDWVAGNFCLFSKDGSFPIGGGTTDYEFLSGVGLLFDALDGEFDDLHDLGYAIGTAHVRGTDGSCQNIDCCRTKVTGKYKITDRFAFHASPIRQQNDYYDAGVFLQNNNCPKKYRSIGWFVNCTLSKTLDGCNAPPIPPG